MANAWIEHLKKFWSKNKGKMSYSEAMKAARKTYKKGATLTTSKTKSTKGGDFVKYEKKSKAAGSFRSAFKSGCANGAKGFSWDGRSYSCSKAGPKKAKKAVARGGQGGSSPE